MITIFRTGYVLLLSYNPCDIFYYYNVTEMHGLNIKDCKTHANTKDSAYIAGWSNFVPKASSEYIANDDRFIFINLSRCTDPVKTTGLIMHEMMHHSLWMHSYNAETREEDIITWAEEETYEVFKLVKPMLGKVVKQAITFKSE
jgi:hypothetical protein